jgi:hypothetical protein
MLITIMDNHMQPIVGDSTLSGSIVWTWLRQASKEAREVLYKISNEGRPAYACACAIAAGLRFGDQLGLSLLRSTLAHPHPTN